MVVLQKEFYADGDVYVEHYVTDNHDVPAEELLRNVVKAFFETDEGKKAMEETSNDFNWGDLGNYVSNDLLENFELEPANPSFEHPLMIVAVETVSVNHDEILIPDHLY